MFGRAWSALGAALALALALSACGANHHAQAPARSRHIPVDVYASLPLNGDRAAQAAGTLNGIRLAYAQAHGRAGRWRVRLIVRDDSSPSGSGWDPVKTAQNARAAASDANAVYYIGELDSAATEISGPILNVAGVPQVSPLSTYPGLTAGAGGLDPTGKATLLRLAPSDTVQAGADLEAAQRAHCTRVALVHDDTLEGTGLADQLFARRGQFGIQIASDQSLAAVAADFAPYVAAIKAGNDRCLIYAGTVSPNAVRLFGDVAAGFRGLVRAIGSDGVCTAPFTSALASVALVSFRCTSPGGDLKASADGRAFLSAYAAAYHVAPDPVAVYGYEAMKLGIDTIAGLGARGDEKAVVRDALFATRARPSAIGTYSFDRDGDSTASSYGLYDVGTNGAPSFMEELTP